jgi:hypothetical protein
VPQRPAEWFRNEERYGVDALAGWIRHPAVRGILERRSVPAEITVLLFAEFLVDQVQMIRFCSRVFDVAYRFPDGTEEPNPFDHAEPEHCSLTPAQRAMTDRAVGDFRAVVMFTALDLARAGHPLDPQCDGDLAVVGQLLLLPSTGHEIPWDDPPAVLAGKLQAPGISAVFRDGRAVTARDGRSERAAINIDRIRRHVRTGASGPHLRCRTHAAKRATPRPVPGTQASRTGGARPVPGCQRLADPADGDRLDRLPHEEIHERRLGKLVSGNRAQVGNPHGVGAHRIRVSAGGLSQPSVDRDPVIYQAL